MVKPRSCTESSEFAINVDKRSYTDWFVNQYQPDYSKEEIRKRRGEVLMRIIDGELTETQKTYLLEYLIEDLNVSEIVERHGKDKSTITRTINRAYRKVYKILWYLAPEIGLPTSAEDAPEQNNRFFYDRTTGRQIRKQRKENRRGNKTIRSIEL